MFFAPSQGCAWWPLRAAQCGQPSGPRSIPAAPRLLPGCSFINSFVCKYSCTYLLVFVHICMYLYMWMQAQPQSHSCYWSAVLLATRRNPHRQSMCNVNSVAWMLPSCVEKWKNWVEDSPLSKKGAEAAAYVSQAMLCPPPWAIAEDATAPVWAVTRAANLGLLRTIWLYDIMTHDCCRKRDRTCLSCPICGQPWFTEGYEYHLSQSFSQVKSCR